MSQSGGLNPLKFIVHCSARHPCKCPSPHLAALLLTRMSNPAAPPARLTLKFGVRPPAPSADQAKGAPSTVPPHAAAALTASGVNPAAVAPAAASLPFPAHDVIGQSSSTPAALPRAVTAAPPAATTTARAAAAAAATAAAAAAATTSATVVAVIPAQPARIYDLHDINLATDVALQSRVVDGLLVRLVKHPFGHSFAEPFLTPSNPHVTFYSLLAVTMPEVEAVKYGLTAIQRVFFKDNHYPSFGHLNDDINRLLDLSITIHSAASWGETGRRDLIITARDIVARAQRLKAFWRDLIVEFLSNLADGRVTELMPELLPRRAARDAFVLPRPLTEGTVPLIARSIGHLAARKEGKFFARPPHEIWGGLGEAYYAAIDNKPMDLRTMRAKAELPVEAGGPMYASFQAVADDLDLLLRNAHTVNRNAPPGSEGAKICEAADSLRAMWEWDWNDSAIMIEVRMCGVCVCVCAYLRASMWGHNRFQTTCMAVWCSALVNV